MNPSPDTSYAVDCEAFARCWVGTYRIIYQLAEIERTVRVAAIRHRAIAYRTDPR